MKKKITAIVCIFALLCPLMLPITATSDTVADNPSINDVLEILKCLAKLPSEYDNSDLNPTMTDALNLLRYLAKLEETTDWVRPTPAITTNSQPAVTSTSELTSVSVPVKSFKSVERFLEFVKNDEKINDSVLKDIYVPKNVLPGFEISDVSYFSSNHHGIFQGSIDVYYQMTDYVYNEKLSSLDNQQQATAVYSIIFSEDGMEFDEGAVTQLTNAGYELLKFENRQAYYAAVYSSNSHSSGAEELLFHVFDFIDNGKRIRVQLPAHAVDGSDVYDMVKYLEMIPVVS
jgi:hypothetical protein